MIPLDCVVVGAGIHGLCTAFWLRRRGLRRIVVVERHGPAHSFGSSHGSTRITRSSYHEPSFVRLAERANAEAWPAIERAIGRVLRVATPGVFFGPEDGPFGDYLRATLGTSTSVEQVATDLARNRFPLLRFEPGDSVMIDHSAAMLLAAETMQGLRDWLQAQGVELRWNTVATHIDAQQGHVDVALAATTLRARTAVLAAGPWLSTLMETPPEPLVVLRQTVGFFDVDAPEEDCIAGVFPVWARIGRGSDDFHYGLPSNAGTGLKAAVHRTRGIASDPDAAPPPVDEGALMAVARQRFAVPVRGLRAAEHCIYTMTRSQDFHVGRQPTSPNLITIAACSGHGFKFGPIVGDMAADLATTPGP
ncbi:MAG: FAD-dependent oxidoreductase [Planctomycetota bacterium]